jgi:hypothetical protein
MPDQQNHTISRAFEPITTYHIYSAIDAISIYNAIEAEASSGSDSATALCKAMLQQYCKFENGDVAFPSKHMDRYRAFFKRRKKVGEVSEMLRIGAELASKASKGAVTGEEIRRLRLKALRE